MKFIETHCASCQTIARYRNRDEARRHGWTGMGWERSTVYRCYWGECPACAAKRSQPAASEGRSS